MSTLKVDVCEIERIDKHPNADLLEIISLKGKGWSVVAVKGKHKVGESVIYIPVDAILPLELSDRLKCTQYLHSQRVKAAKLRGIVSCGLVFENDGGWTVGTDVAEIFGITKYDPPEPMTFGGQNVRENPRFHHYTNIENWNNHPNVIQEGEEVVVTEKIHGTNWRATIIDDVFYIGSHHNTKKEVNESVYWQAAKKYCIEERMRECYGNGDPHVIVLFGEVYGRVQDLRYGLPNEIALRLFDCSINGTYYDWDFFMKTLYVQAGINFDLGSYPNWPLVEHVPVLYQGPFTQDVLKLAEGEAFAGGHIREGIVIRPAKERWDKSVGRVILKKINPEYLVRKKGTEFH